MHRIKNGYIFVPTNKLKHKTMTTNNNNFRFTDPTNFASHVMPFCINGEIAEIELTDRPNDFVLFRKKENVAYRIVLLFATIMQEFLL